MSSVYSPPSLFAREDLATGIQWALSADNYAQLSENARQKVLAHFDSQLVAKRYIELYREILSKT